MDHLLSPRRVKPLIRNHLPIMRMRWRHVLFAHWPIEPATLRSLVPDELEIDTFDGRAWVGLIPFTMEDVSPLVLPPMPRFAQSGWSALWGGAIKFHECNVRTYVYPRDQHDDPAARGVWFFSLDASSRLAVHGARTFWGLPYQHARIHLHRTGDVVDYGVDRIGCNHSLCLARQRCSDKNERARARAGVRAQVQAPPMLHIRWRALDPMPPSQPGDLAHFLTERYCLYAQRNGAVLRSRIAHKPWPLRSAEVLALDDSLVRAAGIEIDQTREPLLYHADELDVRAWRLTRSSASPCE